MSTDYISRVTPIILTGGLGTRLRSVLVDRPKTMASVADRPFLEYILEQVRVAGFSKAVLCVGYMSDHIRQHFGGEYSGMKLEYSIERALLGTAGAVRFALGSVDTSHVLVMNGDSFCAQALDKFVSGHFQANASNSMLITQVEDTKRYGLVNVSDQDRIVSFEEKGAASGPGWINAGIYLLEKESLMAIPSGRNLSLEKEVFPEMCARLELAALRASDSSFIDIGTPESFARANLLFESWGTSLLPKISQSEVRL